MNNKLYSLLYHDDQVIVVDKPTGLLTIPDGYDFTLPNLRNILEEDFGRIWVVHRLDKDASGVIIFARTALIHKLLNQQFQDRLVIKKYFALCHGVPMWNRKEINCPLRKNGDRKHRTVLDQVKGKKAHTIIQVSQVFRNETLFSIQILTGITHQIRAHLSALGFPIIGDNLYSRYCGILNFPKTRVPLGLHSYSLNFSSQLNLKISNFEAKLPERFSIMRKIL